MKRFTPFLIGALFGALLLAAFTLGQVAAAPMAATGCFSDTNGHWAETFICWAADFGIVGGFPDGTYRPENNVTRAQASVMLKNTASLVRATGTQFDSPGVAVLIGENGDFVEVTITAPVNGALLVNGSLNLYCRSSISSCNTSNGNVYVNVDGTNYNRQYYALENSTTENLMAWNSSNSAYIPVGAGEHTVRLRVSNFGSGTTYVWSGGINVLFVPFDGDGNEMAAPPASIVPAGTNGAELQGPQE